MQKAYGGRTASVGRSNGHVVLLDRRPHVGEVDAAGVASVTDHREAAAPLVREPNLELNLRHVARVDVAAEAAEGRQVWHGGGVRGGAPCRVGGEGVAGCEDVSVEEISEGEKEGWLRRANVQREETRGKIVWTDQERLRRCRPRGPAAS